jgi:hypothetical protein
MQKAPCQGTNEKNFNTKVDQRNCYDTIDVFTGRKECCTPVDGKQINDELTSLRLRRLQVQIRAKDKQVTGL